LTVKKINLALQGGGAHGAFTWGVLDQMLQDPRIEIAALSGTSAGALNAAALKGAREKLGWLWTTIAGSNGDNMEQW
jgi:NTE family protein